MNGPDTQPESAHSAESVRARRVAYADPPYLGTSNFTAKRAYGKHHPEAGDWDDLGTHQALIDKLVADYPDGWALSLSSPSLRLILPLCPTDVRVAAWVKPFASFKPGVNPAYTWEPVIFRGNRKRTRTEDTVKDHIAENIMLKKGLTGAKPPGFCVWVFEMLGLTPADELVDLFPGTGIVAATWEWWRGTQSDGLEAPDGPR